MSYRALFSFVGDPQQSQLSVAFGDVVSVCSPIIPRDRPTMIIDLWWTFDFISEDVPYDRWSFFQFFPSPSPPYSRSRTHLAHLFAKGERHVKCRMVVGDIEDRGGRLFAGKLPFPGSCNSRDGESLRRIGAAINCRVQQRQPHAGEHGTGNSNDGNGWNGKCPQCPSG